MCLSLIGFGSVIIIPPYVDGLMLCFPLWFVCIDWRFALRLHDLKFESFLTPE